jgi:PAS domain S-box-containing protein
MDPKFRVMLVEDNPGDARLVRELLVSSSTAQFELAHVERLSEALTRLETERFDVLLLDLSLPDSQGLATFLTTRDRTPGLPIVVLTGLDDETLAMQAVQEGAQDYLVKGQVDGNALVRAMRYAIGRTHAEQRLRLVQSAVHQAQDAVIITSADLEPPGPQILYVNPAFSMMSGYTAVEVLGQTPRLLQGPQTDRAELDDLRQTLQQGATYAGHLVNYRKDGSTYSLELHIAPIRNASGTIANWVSTQRALSGLQPGDVPRPPQAAALSQEQPVEASWRASGAVGDLNTLLRVLMGYDDTLVRDLSSSVPHALVAPSPQPVVDLDTVVTTMSQRLQRLLGADITLFTLLGLLSGGVRAEVGHIEQILMNLAVYARDTMPQGGKFLIETAPVDLDVASARWHVIARPGAYVMLAVSIGGPSADVAPGKGAELGLSTVYGLVRQSGGYIWTDKDPGQGIVFRIYLPRLEEPVTAPPLNPASSAPP